MPRLLAPRRPGRRGGHRPADAPPSLDQLAAAARTVVAREDREYFGFAAGPAFETPKFPNTPVLRFLQHPALTADAPGAADVASRALSAMARSDLHDTVEGGFFRYATRRDWSVPHIRAHAHRQRRSRRGGARRG